MAAFRATRDEAKDAESELRQELKMLAGHAEHEAQRPEPLRQLLESYALDMWARGRACSERDQAEHHQSRPANAPGRAQEGLPGVSVPRRRVLRRRRDARPLAPPGGGAAGARADAVSVPGDCEVGDVLTLMRQGELRADAASPESRWRWLTNPLDANNEGLWGGARAPRGCIAIPRSVVDDG
jgi:hypothetical protein